MLVSAAKLDLTTESGEDEPASSLPALRTRQAVLRNFRYGCVTLCGV